MWLSGALASPRAPEGGGAAAEAPPPRAAGLHCSLLEAKTATHPTGPQREGLLLDVKQLPRSHRGASVITKTKSNTTNTALFVGVWISGATSW